MNSASAVEKSHGMNGVVINWFASYLDDRSQYVRCSKSSSTTSKLLCGLPQGLFLVPILFVLYTTDILQLVKCHRLLPHGYTNDTNIYAFSSLSEVDTLSDRISTCFDSVSD